MITSPKLCNGDSKGGIQQRRTCKESQENEKCDAHDILTPSSTQIFMAFVGKGHATSLPEIGLFTAAVVLIPSTVGQTEPRAFPDSTLGTKLWIKPWCATLLPPLWKLCLYMYPEIQIQLFGSSVNLCASVMLSISLLQNCCWVMHFKVNFWPNGTLSHEWG